MDIKINTAGDLLFEYQEAPQQFDLIFNHKNNTSPSLDLQFSHISNTLTPMPAQALHLSFAFSKEKHTYKAIAIQDSKESYQRVSNIIRTTLTDIKHDPNYGSNLELYIHGNLRDSSLMNNVKNIISEAVRKVLLAPKIIVEPKVQLNFAGYYQGIHIKVYDFDKLIGTYDLI